MQKPVIIEDRKILDQFVGVLVTLRGPLIESKIPTILGVDVDGDQIQKLGGATATATGILRRETVTQEQLDHDTAANGQIPNRGAGVFYSLAPASRK
ncbi:MAG: hypothetical protein HY077_14470 [Elusimicrobia bacterium]|nr:hypothetical protein [Elusimicrobiota bacterium]